MNTEQEERTMLRALRVGVLKEPTQIVALAYFWLTAVGYARLFGTGLPFGLNVFDFASASDFLLAGLRDPFVPPVALALGVVVARNWLWTTKLAEKSTSPRARFWLRLSSWLLAVTLLAVASVGSALYRARVVKHATADCSSCPQPTSLLVTVPDSTEPKRITARLVIATAEYLIYFEPSANNSDTGTTHVLSRDEVKQLDIDVK